MKDASKVVKYDRREWAIVRKGNRRNPERTAQLPRIRITLSVNCTRLSCNRLDVNNYAAPFLIRKAEILLAQPRWKVTANRRVVS